MADEVDEVDWERTIEALRELEGETVDVLVSDGENEQDWQGQLGAVVIVESPAQVGKEVGTVSLQVGLVTFIEIKPSACERVEIGSERVTFHLRSGRVAVARSQS